MAKTRRTPANAEGEETQAAVVNSATEVPQEEVKTSETLIEDAPEEEAVKASSAKPSAPANAAIEVKVAPRQDSVCKVKALATESATIGKQVYRLVEGKVYEVPAHVAGVLQLAKIAVKL